MNDQAVLIVGAGPTGLVLALWLTKLGVRVRIIDKTAEPGTTSRALAVQARTLETYRQAGLAEDVVDAGVKVAAVNLWAGGSNAARAPLTRLGEGLSPFPFALVYAQDEHEKLLIDRLSAMGVTIERQTELVRFDEGPGFILSIIRGPDDQETACRTAYLAGCDGARSTVRETLKMDFPGGTYSGLFYVADAVAEGPAADNEIHVDLEDADFMAVFPLKGSGRVRLVGPIGWAADTADNNLNSGYVADRAKRNLKLKVSKINWFSTYHVHHRVAEHFRKSRAFLLGDAAHIHSPVGGQGMNTGIGDAVNLAWKLAAVLKGNADSRLLDTYEPERIAFARRLVATTDRAFTIVTRQGGTARWVRTRVVPWILPRLLRMRWMQLFLFYTISQIGVHYRNSWLSVGSGSGARAGDRLPWVEFEPGKDNFQPLTLEWQVHVYGELGDNLSAVCDNLRLQLSHFEWKAEMRKAGIVRGALYLVRPDGYIALADRRAEHERLTKYFDDHGIVPHSERGESRLAA